jgi:microcystin degradation protein MlrC
MQHETNTFAPSKADYAAFVDGGGWPTMQFGESLIDAVSGANIPIRGAIDALHGAGHKLLPLVWAAASPSAHVTDDAFERIIGELCRRLDDAMPVDGVYLDLHGAMVTETCDDGEGEILHRVREIVGPRVPVVASLDLHANVTRRMVEYADAFSIYRTYPHIDMADTGARAAHLLLRAVNDGNRFDRAFSQLDFLTGLPAQSTFLEPAQGLYRLLADIDRRTGVALSFAMGFPMADFDECGMSVLGYGEARAAQQAVTELADAVRSAEGDFSMTLYEADDAVRRAMDRGVPGRPVVVADTQDNPGAGGNGDTTGLLESMMRLDAQEAVFGMLIDPAAAKQAHEIGVGRAAEFRLGAISGVPGHVPVTGRFTVEQLGSGQFTCTGAMFSGFRMDLGAMALLRSGGVAVVLASKKCQAADQEMFRHVGIEPARHRMVAVKSSVHFRADFQPIASEIITACAPGPSLADPADFAWTRLRPGMRLGPLGPEFHPG